LEYEFWPAGQNRPTVGISLSLIDFIEFLTRRRHGGGFDADLWDDARIFFC
jgi:hypothetical protein